MRFAFDDDQLAFRDAVRDLLAKECPPEVVRAAWPAGPDEAGASKGDGARADAARLDDVWAALADMGVLGVAVPEAEGGLGLTELDWVLLAEETGYAALPHPFVETVGVAAPLLAGLGDDRLAGLLDGTAAVGVVALGEPVVPWGDRVRSALLVDYDEGRNQWSVRSAAGGPAPGDVLGDDDLAPLIDMGRRAVALDRWSGASADRTSGTDAASAGATGVADGGPVVDRPGDDAPGAGGGWADVWAGATDVGTDRDAAAAFDRGALGVAAQLVGLGRRMLDLTVGYVAERRQFGVPVGSQQAVKHHLADAALGLRFAAPAVYRAAHSLATGASTTHRDVSMAKALASDAARTAGRKALQCHGAIGYTTEYDLHLYLKRAEALARTWGDAAWHRGRVAWALGLITLPQPEPPPNDPL